MKRLIAAVTVFALVVAGVAVLAMAKDRNRTESVRGLALTASETRGRAVFADTCATCHTLAATASTGTVGPDLDVLGRHGLSAPLVAATIKHGMDGQNGTMPVQLVGGDDAQAVAAFVGRVAGCPRTTPEYGSC